MKIGDRGGQDRRRDLLESCACAGLIDALFRFLGKSDLMAYLAMMTVRLMELRRVLKTSGGLYLRCDPTAAHYLKIINGCDFRRREISQRNRVAT
jgi:hypothetical protein